MTTTQSDVLSMSAGDDLDERVGLATEARWWLADGTPYPLPTALDRLRRMLGLPPPHPSIGNPTVYCGPQYSSGETLEESSTLAIDSLISRFSLSYPGSLTDSALVKSRWYVADAMDRLGLE